MIRWIKVPIEVDDNDIEVCGECLYYKLLNRYCEYFKTDIDPSTYKRCQACLDADVTLKQALYDGAASIAFSQGAKIAELKKRIAVLERAMRMINNVFTVDTKYFIEQAEKELEGK